MKINKTPPDVFGAFMAVNAEFCNEDIPKCATTAKEIPSKIITYNEAKKAKKEEDFNAFVSFYKHDGVFDGPYNSIWLHPWEAYKVLRKFRGVITPDFSMYLDFPKPIKLYNTYRMRVFGHWLTMLGVPVYNNVRYGTDETWSYCFEGISKHSTIVLSTYSALNDEEEKAIFLYGFDKMMEVLEPELILFYGKCPKELLLTYPNLNYVEYETELDREEKKKLIKERKNVKRI